MSVRLASRVWVGEPYNREGVVVSLYPGWIVVRLDGSDILRTLDYDRVRLARGAPE